MQRSARDLYERQPVVLAIATLSLLLAVGGDPAREWGRYHREALEAGEAWRLLTAHLVHLGWGHAALNLTALLLIGLLVDDLMSEGEWLAAAVGCALAIDLGLYLWDPDVRWYVGLSGVLHGFVAFAAVRLIHARTLLGGVLAFGLLLKIAWEQAAGPIPFTASSTGGPVVVAAHLYGAVAGAAIAIVSQTLRTQARKRAL